MVSGSLSRVGVVTGNWWAWHRSREGVDLCGRGRSLIGGRGSFQGGCGLWAGLFVVGGRGHRPVSGRGIALGGRVPLWAWSRANWWVWQLSWRVWAWSLALGKLHSLLVSGCGHMAIGGRGTALGGRGHLWAWSQVNWWVWLCLGGRGNCIVWPACVV